MGAQHVKARRWSPGLLGPGAVTVSGCLLALGGATDASAQAGAPVGPAAVAGREFSIAARLRVETDSNVARGNGSVAAIRNIRPNDIRYTPNLDVHFGTSLGQQPVFLDADLGYEFYQYNTSLKRERISIGAGTSRRFGLCSTSLTGRASKGISDAEDLTLAEQRSVQRNYSATLFAGCQIGANLGQTVGLSHSESHNSGGVSFVDSRSDSINTALTYGNAVAGNIALTGSYSTSKYDNPPVAAGVSSLPGFESYSVGVQYGRPIGARLVGNAAVGYFIAPSKVPGDKDQTGVTWNAGLNYRATDRLSADMSYNRNITPSNRVGANSSIQSQARLGLNYRVNPKLRINLNGALGRRTYRAQSLAGVLFASREETRTVRGLVSYDFGRRASVAFDASFNKVDTDLSQLDYSSKKFGVTLSTNF